MSQRPPQKTLAHILLEPLVENFEKNFIWDTVDRPRMGSVVYCGLLFGQEGHSGIYVGKNKIVSLSGDGEIVKQRPAEFLAGVTTGDTIYVSCQGKSPVGNLDVAKRAQKAVGHHRHYNFLLDNCHRFTSGCLKNDFDNTDILLSMVKDTAGGVLGADEWRAWANP